MSFSLNGPPSPTVATRTTNSLTNSDRIIVVMIPCNRMILCCKIIFNALSNKIK